MASISISPVGILGLMASLSRSRTLPTAATTYSGRTCSPLSVALRRQLFIEHHLGNAAAVAHIEEDQVAVIAAAVHPAHEHHVFAGVGGAQFAAVDGCVPDCLKSRAQRHSFVVLKATRPESCHKTNQNVG